MDGSLVWKNQHHQSGTLMPLGAVHPIIASASEAIHFSTCCAMDCFASLAMTAKYGFAISSATPRSRRICASFAQAVLPSENSEGVGNAGRPMHPQPRVQK